MGLVGNARRGYREVFSSQAVETDACVSVLGVSCRCSFDLFFWFFFSFSYQHFLKASFGGQWT